jgi:hypothetical protein
MLYTPFNSYDDQNVFNFCTVQLLGTIRINKFVKFFFRNEKFNRVSKMEGVEMESLSDFSAFHRFIFEGKVDEVQRFINSNPNEKIATFDDSSAIAMSLKCGTLEVYKVLVANGFKLDPSEDIAMIMQNIDVNPKVKSAMKVKLKEIIQKYMKESTRKHLFKLNLMVKLAPSTPEDKRREFEGIIALTFEELAKIADIEKIMKYVASARGESSVFITSSSALSNTNHMQACTSTSTSRKKP